MKKIIPILLFVLLPFSAFAADATPASCFNASGFGNSNANGHYIYFEEVGGHPSFTNSNFYIYWKTDIGGGGGVDTVYYLDPELSGQADYNIDTGIANYDPVGAYTLDHGTSPAGSISDVSCGGGSPTGSPTGSLFGNSGQSQQADISPNGLMAAVGVVSYDTFSSVFPYLALSAGVFLGFYLIQKITMLLGQRSRDKIKK